MPVAPTSSEVGLVLLEIVTVLVAAVCAGAMNAVIGAGTLITFPTLLFLGIPPVTANVSNTLGLVPGGIAAAATFRRTLRGTGRPVAVLAASSALGGVVGAVMLLVLPPDTFESLVPPLLIGSGVLVLLQPRIASWLRGRRDGRAVHRVHVTSLLLAVTSLTGIYGGYFGAAQGVILLAVLATLGTDDLVLANGVKNVLAATANLVAALWFLTFASVDWFIAVTVAVGSTTGGVLGGRYARTIPPWLLRTFAVTVAVLAAGVQVFAR